jgi:flavodoxin I
MNVTVIYGSDGGCTKALAAQIASKIKGKAIDIRKAKVADFEDCDLLILGAPTVGLGELQSDWEDRLGVLEEAQLAQRKVALFGTGDQMTYPDTFVDAMGVLYDLLVAKGAHMVGFTDPDGYDFQASTALRDGRFVGLALDEDCQSSKTSGRISSWINQLM